MTDAKRCIFHLPLKTDPNHASASQIRPHKMLQAFRNIGYDVDVVMGESQERASAIKHIKQQMQSGVHYDFLYSESSTMPTLLTDSDHFPRHPLLDFSFFRVCGRAGIPIGLFYRDCYWLFPEYDKIGRLKSTIGRAFYRHDVRMYRKYLDILYVPVLDSALPYKNLLPNLEFVALPPGCDANEDGILARRQHIKELRAGVDRPLRIFYVGGIGSHYGFHQICEAVAQSSNVELKLCVRKDDWARAGKAYESYLRRGNISIVHASGDELIPYLGWADIGNLYFDFDPYRAFAMPYKTFEHLACGLPSISSDDTVYGRFVKNSGIGFATGRDQRELVATIARLASDRQLVASVSEQCIELIGKHTWERRAEHVAKTLAEYDRRIAA